MKGESMEGAKVIAVTNWPWYEHREMPARAGWFKSKVDYQGDGWLALCADERPADVLATWEIVRGLAVLSPYRGLLLTDTDDPAPRDEANIAMVCRFPIEVIRHGLDALAGPRIGWVTMQNVCISERDGRADYAATSKAIWRRVFYKGCRQLCRKYSVRNGKSIAAESRGHREGVADAARGHREGVADKSRLTKTLTETLTINPSHPLAPSQPATGDGGGNGERERIEAVLTTVRERLPAHLATEENAGAWMAAAGGDVEAVTQGICDCAKRKPRTPEYVSKAVEARAKERRAAEDALRKAKQEREEEARRLREPRTWEEWHRYGCTVLGLSRDEAEKLATEKAGLPEWARGAGNESGGQGGG